MLAGVAELALALAASAERQLETATQGDAFVGCRAAPPGPAPALERCRRRGAGAVAYPVAVGVAAAGHGIALGESLEAFLLGFVANLVSAAVRLGPVGQTDGQRVIAALVARRPRQLPRSPSARASTISAARPSAPTSRRCGTRPNTRGLFRLMTARSDPTARCASASAARSAPARRR